MKRVLVATTMVFSVLFFGKIVIAQPITYSPDNFVEGKAQANLLATILDNHPLLFLARAMQLAYTQRQAMIANQEKIIALLSHVQTGAARCD